MSAARRSSSTASSISVAKAPRSRQSSSSRSEGEARATLLPAPTTAAVRDIVEAWIDPSSTLMTDANKIYRKIGTGFAAHHSVNHSKKRFYDKTTDSHINTAESFGSQIERALIGVYHRLSPEHLQRYLDEIAWHWNRREFVRKIAHSQGSSTRGHNIWQPVPVLEKMTELLRNGRGRQIRRSRTFGIQPPDKKDQPLATDAFPRMLCLLDKREIQ